MGKRDALNNCAGNSWDLNNHPDDFVVNEQLR
jgi:hypothetical protein